VVTGTLLGILARHNLCSPLVSRQGKVDTVIVVRRQANVQATHALYDWIAAQLERFGLEEWAALARSSGQRSRAPQASLGVQSARPGRRRTACGASAGASSATSGCCPSGP